MNTFQNKVQKLINELPATQQDPLDTLKKALDGWKDKDKRTLLKFEQTTSVKLLTIIAKMNNSTSFGNDRMDSMMIKHGIQHLHAPLVYVINLSIQLEKFATRWKIGKNLPLHKGKGLSAKNPESYRPISLLPIIGKITERIIQPQIIQFLLDSKQLNLNHHSYRPQHSTITAMLQFSDTVFEGCNKNLITTAVTLDQSATFDVLKHETLMKKLELYNFSKSALNWMQTYLEDRSSFVSIGTRESTFRKISSGVPQGSVLGPIL